MRTRGQSEQKGRFSRNSRLRFDRDTIPLGDSLTGLVGVVFKSSISTEEKQLLISTLAYRIDTVDRKLEVDTQFYKARRVNDSTYRFAFLPKYQNSDGVTKRSIFAAIKVDHYSKDNQKQEHIFRNRFDYYIKK